MMKNTGLLFLIFVFSFINLNTSTAQELLLPLSLNAELAAKSASDNHKLIIPHNTFFVFEPISTLPFFDDFTISKFADYDTSHYAASMKSDSAYVSHKINGTVVTFDTIYVMESTSYTYTFNVTTQMVDSVANPSFSVTEYGNKLIPSQVTSTFDAWNSYYRIRKTIISGSQYNLDTIYIQPDRMLVFESDTLHYIKVPAGSAFWKNKQVFINGTYPLNPPSLNVATFDGLDSTGYPYNFDLASAHGSADTLTSAPFNLSSYNASNRLYLSFYYQAAGRGNQPEPEDSLILDFYGSDGNWHRKWSKTGIPLNTDSSFNRVMIALDDPLFLHKNFSFRLMNYATLSGNLDHWHLDYIRIDLDADTVIHDICWKYPGLSLFNNLQQMPYQQYTGAPAEVFENYIGNLSPSSINVNYAVNITDYFNTNFFNVSVGNVPFSGASVNNCSNCAQILNPLFGTSFSYPSSMSECRKFAVTQVIQNVSPEQNKYNDTLVFTQVFGDCFAYDDGTAEAAYGVTTAYAQMAVKYNAPVSDTLKSVRIYFNPVVVNAASVQQFTLIVWNDDGSGKPGNELYRDQYYYEPRYENAVNAFIDYPIRNQTIIVNGNFFVGLEQLNAAELNIGLDRNTNTMSNNYYNTTGTWYNTQFPGSWMIRPAFGNCYNFMTPVILNQPEQITVSPNPADEIVFLSGVRFPSEIKIINSEGSVVSTLMCANGQVETGDLPNGLYIILVTDLQNGAVNPVRVLIAH